MSSAGRYSTTRGLWLVLALIGTGLATQLEAQDTPEQRTRREGTRRGWVGISFRVLQQAPDQVAAAVIDDVFPESPADRAGVQEGDTIVRWNGRTNLAEVMEDLAVEPGDTVRLRVRRGGRDRDLTIVADDRPRGFAWRSSRRGGDLFGFGHGRPPRELRLHMDSLRVHADSLHRHLRSMLRDSLGPQLWEFHGPRGPRSPRLRPDDVRMPLGFDLELGMRAVAGAELTEINAGLASYFGTEHGVLVLRVAPETPASRSGLQAGDVVVAINDQRVETVRDLRQAIGAARHREVKLDLIRKGRGQEIRMRWER